MATPQTQLIFTVDEYLTAERESEERHEFLDGLIYAMAGESPDHGTICSNLTIAIGSQLKGSPCQVWSKDTKIRSGPLPTSKWKTKGLFSYPDLVVVCGAGEYLDEHRDVLLNPRVIIEVLSPSTEAFDRGEKFLRYQNWLPTLTDYLLISQSSPMATHYIKHKNDGWLLYFYEGLEQNLDFQSIECRVSLSEVYKEIKFSPLADSPEQTEKSEKKSGKEFDLTWNLIVELRKETLEAIRMRTQVIGLKITFLSTAIGFIFANAEKGAPKELLVVPAIAAIFFDLLIINYSISIRRIGLYCEKHLEPTLKKLTNMGDQFEFWEAFFKTKQLRPLLAVIANLGLTGNAVLAATYVVLSSTMFQSPVVRYGLLLSMWVFFVYDWASFLLPGIITKDNSHGSKIFGLLLRLFFEKHSQPFVSQFK